MVLGWVLGRHLIRFAAGESKISGRNVLWISGVAGLVTFAVVRGIGGYGDMFLHRTDNSWQQWLHVSKYPPSLAYYSLELGILLLCLALLRTLELRVGVRENGVLYVFGQTAMFCYLVHRLTFETAATYFGLRGFDALTATLWRGCRNAGSPVPSLPLVPQGKGRAPTLAVEILVAPAEPVHDHRFRD